MEITKDIPIPELKTPSRNKYDLWKMEVGDSFAIPFNDTDAVKVRTAVSNYGRRNDKKFVTRKVMEDDQTFLRVWRIDAW